VWKDGTKHEKIIVIVSNLFDLLHIFKACGVVCMQQQQQRLTLKAGLTSIISHWISSLKQP
jgi:hypothetical protein